MTPVTVQDTAQQEQERRSRAIWDEEDYANAIRAMSRNKDSTKQIAGIAEECRARFGVDPLELR